MGFRDLRVINDDQVAPGAGFPTHPHRNMEIVTYMVRGVLEHRDSMGNGELIRPGEIQRMSAGTGITHSEFNHSDQEDLRLLQIWIETAEPDTAPDYEQKSVLDGREDNQPLLVVSRDGRNGSLGIRQDVDIYSLRLTPGASVNWDIEPGRHHWIQVVDGALTVNGQALGGGDGVAISDESGVVLGGVETSDLLIFDLK